MEALDVYLNEIKAGQLRDDNGRMNFAYSTDYLLSTSHEPLSHSLPLRKEPYGHEEVEPVLSNLLPDDIIRTRIGALLKIPRENTFALLKAIGGDCAGAISFFPEGTFVESTPSTGTFRVLSDDEAGRILDCLEQRPLDVGEDGFRISGAGAQDKLIACMRDEKVALPLDGTPSTHIIKTEIRGYPASVENEWFAMSLASASGLNAAACEIKLIGGKRRYICRRYDRIQDGNGIRRLHQEDFCQMLKIDPKRKYENLGGPGIAESFRLMRELALPASDTLEFLDRVIFNYIIGNGDAHGKNFSVLHRGGVPELAPMYDVMSTSVYPDVGRKMAMKIDGEYAFKWITTGKFIRMSGKLGICERIMRRELDKMARRVSRSLPLTMKRAQSSWPSPCYERIAAGIGERLSVLRKGD